MTPQIQDDEHIPNKINKQESTPRHLIGKQELPAGTVRAQGTVCSFIRGPGRGWQL